MSPRRGIAAFGTSLDGIAATAAAADRAGFDSVWTSELYNRSATVALAAIAAATQRCTIGSGIIYGVGRSPLMLAAEARDLEELSRGRFVLGLGNGTRKMIADWHGLDGDAPAVRMEELVELVRRVWRLHEAPIDHEGRFYRLRIAALDDLAEPPARAIPVYTAGVNPRMVETAGRVADGLLGHTLFTPRYVADVVRPAIARGAERAGRDPSDVAVATYTLAAADADEERARRDAAAMIAFYGSVRTYRGIFAASGFGEQADAIREAFARRDVDAMIGAVSDAMVDEFAVAGTPAQVADKLARWDGVVDEIVLSPPSFRVTPDRVEAHLHALIEGCAPQAVAA